MRSHQGARGPGTWGAAEPALDQDDNIKVVARVRPLNERELAAGDTVAVSLLEPASSQMQVCGGSLATSTSLSDSVSTGLVPSRT